MISLILIILYYRTALSAVSSFDKKAKSSMAWNADLTIGSSIKIPISAYKLVGGWLPTLFPTLKSYALHIFHEVGLKNVYFCMITHLFSTCEGKTQAWL